MASRTMPASLGIIISFFLVCNANSIGTTTTNNPGTLLKTEDSLIRITTPSTKTILSPAVDVTNTTFSNTSTTAQNASDVPQFSTSTAAATTQSHRTGSGFSTFKATATPALHSPSTVSSTGPSVTSSNQTYNTTSVVTRVVATSLPTQTKPTPQSNGTDTTNGTATTALSDTAKYTMTYPEIILTSIFSTILVVVTLVILSVGFKRCMRGRSQYYHHPLRETPYESDRYSAPDDTLVISGGLYDAPRIYNPNMTVLEEEESQNDYASFNSRPGQFRLEFLPGDKDMGPVFNGAQRRNV